MSEQVFGQFYDSPKVYNFWGLSGFLSVPAGRNYFMMTDANGQVWASPNELTKEADGTVTGSPKFACDLNADGTYVFIDAAANRGLGIDSPPNDRWSPTN